ncbi:HupE/UreJ family protein [Pseudohongiella spirulinae]|uniref:HupE/UreJ family protein n=1 Tax=Pseudohongiella spirulinae TaxID=1249552 RepID=UPI001F44CA95|nr:HupE/UreJ family protein [Pseudohongiella spirulinae]
MTRIIKLLLITLLTAPGALAHDMTDIARERMASGGYLEVMWTGAEHMLSGYDHLLFLLGVMFFLTRLIDILKFVTAFTLGHTLTLIFATYAGITANHYLIDAVIAVTVMYKGFENINGFERWLGFRAPNLLLMVFAFGLIHGFGLSARLQEVTLADDPALLGKILLFNVGVEVGQIVALLIMAVAIRAWQQVLVWPRISAWCNAGLIIAGAILLVLQLSGYAREQAANSGDLSITVFSDIEQAMGVVSHPDDGGLEQLSVQVIALSSGQTQTINSDADGWFNFSGAVGEQYRISASNAQGDRATTELTLGQAADAHQHEEGIHVPFYVFIALLLLLSSLLARRLRPTASHSAESAPLG